MRIAICLVAAITAIDLGAQSPLNVGFNANNNGGLLWCTFFDLAVVAPNGITITRLDVDCSSAPGAFGSVQIYTTPTTYAGWQQTPAAWTLAATGFIVSAGAGNPSTVCLTNGGMFLPAGSHGLCVRHIEVALRTTSSTGTVTASTAEVQFSGGQAAPATIPFTSTPTNNLIFTGSIHYNVGNVPGPTCGAKATYGTGCYLTGDSWYELFQGLVAFDLNGSVGNEVVLVATPIGAAGYAVTRGAPAWYAPTGVQVLSNQSPPAPLTNDSMSGPLGLPFVFPYPAGSVNVVHACVNGFVHLGPTSAQTGLWTPTAAGAHSFQRRLFPCWADWHAAVNLSTNPASGVYFDVDPSGLVAYVTWLDVADRRNITAPPGVSSINFQVALHAGGTIEYRYRHFVPGPLSSGQLLVGYSKGNNNVSGGPLSVDTGGFDVSAPFVTNGPDSLPMRVDSNAPRFGQSWTITTSDIDPVSPISITFFGTARVDPGLDLGFLGAPGCNAHVDVILATASANTIGTSSTLAIPVPNAPSLSGVVLTAQSAGLTLTNVLGLRTSNGVEGTIGL